MKKTFIIVYFFSCMSFGAYLPRAHRYISGNDIINMLLKNFPGHGGDRTKKLSLKCYSLNSVNRESLGIVFEYLGVAMLSRPNPSLLRWLNACLDEYLNDEFEFTDTMRASFVNDHFSVPLGKKLNLETAEAVNKILNLSWSIFNRDQQKLLVERAIRRLVGPPSVIESNFSDRTFADFVKSNMDIIDMIGGQPSTKQVLQQVNRAIFLSDEFLRY